MGRKERRELERLNKRKDNLIERALKAKENQEKLQDKEVDRIQNELMLLNVSAMFNAFALYLKEKYDANDIEIGEALKWMDDMVGSIGTDQFPTVSDFKLYCASQTHVAILLDEEESKQFDIMESKYQYIILDNSIIQKVAIISCTDEYILITYIGGVDNGRVAKVSVDTIFYESREEAERNI